jgi:hypothetical protein
MMSRDEEEDDRLPDPDNRVGYCRPPAAHQFKPGVSGNPAGRPKGSPTIQEMIEREARRHVKIRTAKGVESMPKQEALVRRLFAIALEGDLKAARLILQSLDMSAKPSREADLEDAIDPANVDDEALMRMLARFGGLRSEGNAE